MDLLSQLMNVTNDGLDIIQYYYPDAKAGRNFKKRPDERTASAAIKRIENNKCKWVLTDFGGDGKAKNALEIAMEEENMDFTEVLKLWAGRYNLLQNYKPASADFKTPRPSDIEYEFNYTKGETHYYIQQKASISEDELKVLGPHVTEKVCKEYGVYSIEFYARKKGDKITEIHSNENFPIFGIFNKTKDAEGEYEWVKILQPKSQDKSYRFFYINGRPKDFVFGLFRAKKLYDSQNIVEDGTNPDDEDYVQPAEQKLQRIVICSGDRDALNMASLGETVIWMNSETADISFSLFKKLKGYAYRVINVPDLDSTGKRQGIKHALDNIEMKTAWLPEELTKNRDWRGHPQKDFTDYCSNYKNKFQFETLKFKVNLLLDNAYQAQFWSVKTSKEGNVTYQSSLANLFYFLRLNGFYKVEDPENENGYQFVKVTDHLVEIVHADKIKDFVLNYLEEKRNILGDRVIPIGLLNLFYTPNKLSESVLSSIDGLEFRETKATATTDYIHFKQQVWKITPTGVENLDTKNINSHVWDKNVIENKIVRLYDKEINTKAIQLDDPYFKISKIGDEYKIDIQKNDCEFLNYMINISRVYWKKEIENMNGEQRKTHLQKYPYTISAPGLTEEEIAEQQAHLVNKIYTFGYILHRYKEENKPWVVLMMDNEVVSADESHGGTGKSIFTNAPRIFLQMKLIGSRNPRLFDNDFLFDGVTKYTDYILFDDADSNFKFDQLYTLATNDFNVNPKGKQPYVIPFRDAPKMVISTNYTLKNQDPSTSRRLLEVTASDWYHHPDENGENKRDPIDDFGHRLFSDWDDYQWNCYMNLAAQCLSFYLSSNEKISAPNSQLKLRQQLTIMGITFQEWADRELPQYINQNIDKVNGIMVLKETLHSSAQQRENMKGMSAAAFFKKLKAWCIYNDVELNPKSVAQKDGRIMKKVGGSAVEHYYLYSKTYGQLADELEFDEAGSWMQPTEDDDLPY
ncbi:hypothetical protein QP519_09365 [Weeksella virosa]|uniref:primase-helicase family protein n=2 Tax=Bacteria TaxID=2 RepID=UPI002555DC1B|nr:DUF5906 domain-containing protein [Weeksella virosa]MDK7375741.1 hypothetical protein [Weeksella virosa]